MIVVRETFRLKFGMAAQFKAALVQGKHFFEEAGMKNMRVLADCVTDHYTFVLESSYESLAEMEAVRSNSMSSTESREWYHSQLCPLCESGKREIFTVVM